jgi:hypothetical protein
MKATIWSALAIAVAIVGCENRNADRTYTARTDDNRYTAQNDAQEKALDAQKDMNQAQAEANKKAADAQANANEKAAEAQKEANEDKADAQDKMRDARAEAGQAVTVTGTVSDVNDDSFKMKMADGKSLDLKFSDGSGRISPVAHDSIKEGDQVRASYTEHDGDKVLENLQVIQPSTDQK